MRKINTGDVFKLARLLKKSDVVTVVREAYEAGRQENPDSGKIGMDAITGIICCCTDEAVEVEIYDLISSICEKTLEDVRDQSLETTLEDIQRIAKENNIANFFRSASGLVGKMTG